MEGDGLRSERKRFPNRAGGGSEAESVSQATLTQGEAEEQEGLLGVNPPGLVLQQGRQQSHLCLPSLHIVGLGGGGGR